MSYALREDIVRPNVPSNQSAYNVRIFEDVSAEAVRQDANLFMRDLPNFAPPGIKFVPHIVSLEYTTYITLGTIAPPTIERSVLFTFSDAKKNTYLRYGNEKMSADNGFVAPYDGTLSVATLSQMDPTAANLAINVGGVPEAIIVVASEQESVVLNIPVSAGDIISAENLTNLDLKESTISIIFDYTLPGPPPPPEFPPELRHVVTILFYAYGIDPSAFPL